MSEEEYTGKIYKLGFDYEKNNTNCAQCVLAAVLDILEFRSDDVFKSASGLAGGGAACGDGSCGAYSGGVMALSFFHGRERSRFEDPTATRRASELSKKLHDKFINEYGSVLCKDIQKKIFGRSYNLWDPKECEEFKKAGAYETKCPDVVGKAAKWTLEILQEERLEKQKSK